MEIQQKNKGINEFQRKLYNAQIFYGENALSNIGGVFSFDVDITAEELKSILIEIISKSEGMNLRLNRNIELYRSVEDFFNIEIVNGIYTDDEIMELTRKEMSVPFELYDTCLYSIKIYKKTDRITAFMKLHHIIGDGVSVVVLVKNVEECYHSLRDEGKYECEIIKTEYKKMDSKASEKATAYFRNKLDDYELKKLSYIEDRNASAGVVKLKTPISRKDMTIEFIAAIYTYFFRVLDVNKYSVGFVLGNRKKEEMKMIGMYANTLPLVIDYADNSYKDLLREIKSNVFKLLRFSSFTLGDIYEGEPYEIALSYKTEDYYAYSDIGTITELYNGFIDVPVRIEALEIGNELCLNIFYRKSLFNRELIQNIGEGIIKVFEQIQKGVETLSDIDILTDYDKEMYKELNATEKNYKYQDVVDCFIDNLTDDEVLVSGNNSISGNELFERSVSVASYIRRLGVERVGIDISRSPQMIIAVLGALMAETTFLILSENIPAAWDYVDAVLTKDDVDRAIKCGIDNKTEKQSIYDVSENLYSNKFFKEKRYSYDPDSAAYMIFTSGSTGLSKCIEISRGSLIKRLQWQHESYGLRGNILQKTVNTFDVSIWEMLSVIYGARLFLLEDGDERLPDRIAASLLKYHIEKVHFVPTMLSYFLRYVKDKELKFPYLKEVYVSGEKLDTSLKNRFFNVLPHIRLINLYGPAECTIDVIHHECIPDETDVPIGKPVANTKVSIINEKGQKLPVGFIGEIGITGDLVGKGYIIKGDSGEFQRKAFDKSLYRTGDLGKLGFDGNIYISGRTDSQIKLHGMRVSLSDVKDVVLDQDNVEDAELMYDNDTLKCFLVGSADEREIRKNVANKISAYAVPRMFIYVDKLPMGVNHKVDKRKLLEMEPIFREKQRQYGINYQSDNSSYAHLTKWSLKLKRDLISEVSRYIEFENNENLFERGLDSITIIKITSALQEKGYNISFSDFYENMSIDEIVNNIKNRRYYTFLKKAGSDRVLICFPFAGGEPQNYDEIAKQLDIDVIGIYMSSFSPKSTMIDIAKSVAGSLRLAGYKKVYVLGHCVGSMAALEYISRINTPVDGLILLAPSIRPYSQKKREGFNPWRLISDKNIEGILRLAGSEYDYDSEIIKRFRIDTDRFFRYSPDNGLIKSLISRKNMNILVVIGTKDLFTFNSKSIIKKINQLTGRRSSVYHIKNGKHFLTEKAVDEVTKIIKQFQNFGN